MAFLGRKANPFSSGPFANVGGTGGTAQGAGGGGSPWVNIQEYLQNAVGSGTSASKDALTEQLTGEFEGEKAEAGRGAQTLRDFASFAGAGPDWLKDNDLSESVGRQVQTASDAASSDAFQGPVSQVRDYLGQRYGSGIGGSEYLVQNPDGTTTNLSQDVPSAYSYGFGQSSKGRAPTDLKNLTTDESGFYGTTLPNIYQGMKQEPGTSFTPGMSALQQNIDINNPGIRSERAALGAKYKELPAEIAKQNQDVTGLLSKTKGDWESRQAAVRSDLAERSSAAQSGINKDVSEMNTLREQAAAKEPKRQQAAEKSRADWESFLRSWGGDGQVTGGPAMTYGPSGWTTRGPEGNISGVGPDAIRGYAEGKVSEYKKSAAPRDYSQAFTAENIPGGSPNYRAFNTIQNMLGAYGPGYRLPRQQASPYDVNELRRVAGL